MALGACDAVINDLLCFIQNGIESVPVDYLKPLVIDGFNDSAISSARNVVFESLESCEGHEAISIRKSRHRQTGKSPIAAMEVSDIFKVFT